MPQLSPIQSEGKKRRIRKRRSMMIDTVLGLVECLMDIMKD